ncbi:MAG: sugar ABC transporter permease, partial [Lachnospiraceae bacterium]|nr:sugar ABC transporter permease [Lachnospiraceae bacterium]
GNTSIMLMAAIMGISPDLFEAASIDGCTPVQSFFRITLPMIRPILSYTLIVSLIGGLQMFDVPQIFTNGQGNPDRTSYTLIMWLNNFLKAPDYGRAGALSVYLFIISGILCFFVYQMMKDDDTDGSKKAAKKAKKLARQTARNA